MQRSELTHLRYLLKIACVVLPGHALVSAGLLVLGAVLLPIQVVAWLWSSHSCRHTQPYRKLFLWYRRYDAWADRFLGNPYTGRPPR